MSHTCHAKRCSTRCRPQYLMCPHHWRMVPVGLKRKVLSTYRRGQCDDKRPSLAWHEAADAAIASVALLEGCPFGKLRVVEVRALMALAPDLCPAGTATRLAEIDARHTAAQSVDDGGER